MRLHREKRLKRGFWPQPCSSKDKMEGVNEMRKRIWIFCLIFLTFTTAFAKADTHIVANMPIPDRFRAIFEVCGVENEEELFDKIVQYIDLARDPEYANNYRELCKGDPIKIRYGATTKDLISDKKWDLAIISSKDVDLQALADKKLISYIQFATLEPAYRQCLLPDALVAELPSKNEQWAYRVYPFDYNAQENDATLFIIRSGTVNVQYVGIEAILDSRPADMVRELEGIYRAKYWTIDQLIERSEDWDTAFLDLHVLNGQLPAELKRLDEAGLLCDLSQNAYLASRTDQTFKNRRMLPKGIFTEDGRMVAVPYKPCYAYKTQEEEHLFLVNQKSVYSDKALDYGELILKINDSYHGDKKKLTLEEVRKW